MYNVRFPFLQEVVGCPSRNVRLSTAGCRIELEKRIFKLIVKFHDGGLIPTAIAVVGSGEDGGQHSDRDTNCILP